MSSYYSRYRHLAIERSQPAPTPAQIAAIEELLGATLPTSFREYLQFANGGYLEYAIDVPFADGHSEALSFCGLFTAKEGTFCDETFVGEIHSSREYQKIPPGVLPFARDGGGSMVYLDLTAEGSGRVIAFVQGLPEWTGLRQESGYIELAPSFDEYVARLHVDRGAALDHLANDAKTNAHVAATEEWLDIGLPTWRNDAELMQAVAEARRRVS